MLKAITKENKQKVKSILDVCTHVEVLDNGVHVSGHITFDQMKSIVEYLKTKIRQGTWYRCIKDVFDNENKFRLFTKDKYYLCPKDGMLVTDNNKTIHWREWNHPEDCFVEESHVTYK